MERIKVKELTQGATAIFAGDFNKQTKPTKNGGTYTLVRLTDNTGTSFARIWDNLPIKATIDEIEDGDYVEAEVKCTEYGEFISIEIQSIQKVERPIETVVDIEGLKNELRETFKSYKDQNLLKLVTAVFNRADVKERFFISPASQQSGYSFDAGLLAHVIRSIRLSRAVAQVFASWNHNVDNFVAKLNEDLLVTACILHDIGKVRALSKNGHRVEKTLEGEMFEDSYISMKIVLEELDKVSIPEEQRVVLEHVLGSSKGKQGFGALFIPRSREAMAFHLIESLDVQMSNFEFLERNAGAEQTFVQLFQKTMYLGSYDEE